MVQRFSSLPGDPDLPREVSQLTWMPLRSPEHSPWKPVGPVCAQIPPQRGATLKHQWSSCQVHKALTLPVLSSQWHPAGPGCLNTLAHLLPVLSHPVFQAQLNACFLQCLILGPLTSPSYRLLMTRTSNESHLNLTHRPSGFPVSLSQFLIAQTS